MDIKLENDVRIYILNKDTDKKRDIMMT